MTTTQREELAWAAGFFDGEGCVSVGDYHAYARVSVSVTQVDRRVLDRFRAALGVGVVNGPYGRGPHRQTTYRFQARGHLSAQAICAMLWPWLSPIKREQFARCLGDFLSAMKRCPHGRSRRAPCADCRREGQARRGAAYTKTLRLVRKTRIAMLAA